MPSGRPSFASLSTSLPQPRHFREELAPAVDFGGTWTFRPIIESAPEPTKSSLISTDRIRITAIVLMASLAIAMGSALVSSAGSASTTSQPLLALAKSNGGNATSSGKASVGTLEAATFNYRTYLTDQSTQLVSKAEALNAAIVAGDLPTAQAAYLATREPYERMWPLASALDVTGSFEATQAQGGFDWTGFHRIEKGLFADRSTAGLLPITGDLLNNAKSLQAAVPSADLRAVEIAEGSAEMLNEASHHNIFGEEDRYALSDLANMQATIDGSKAAFDALRPALGDDPMVAVLEERFGNANSVLASYKTNGVFVGFGELRSNDTKKLSQALDSLAEPLAYLPAKAGAVS